MLHHLLCHQTKIKQGTWSSYLFLWLMVFVVSLPVFAGPYERMAEFVSFKLKADGPGSRVLLPQAIIKVAHRLDNS